MQDRPTATELIAAVRHFLEQEVLPAVPDQRLRFRTRVAANALTILEREVAAGASPAQKEADRLRALLGVTAQGESEAQARLLREDLSQRIRRGLADRGPWRATVFACLRESIEEKLLISNPKFLGAEKRG